MSTATGRILIIDDERAVNDGCRLVLAEKGHRVDQQFSGKGGLQALNGQTHDVVLLDMKLPDIDGMDILRRLREMAVPVNVIVMTGYSTVQNAVDAMKMGAYDYLAKPFSDDDLAAAVHKALQNKRLKEANLNLRQQLYERYAFSNIVGEDPKLLHIFDEISKAAPTDSTVLIEGESGTGKELFARAIHSQSRRAARQFITVDCSTFSLSLLESELFGHLKGAFTGAAVDRPGIFKVADGGTLFMDEIANLNLEIQGKLLRVMETQEFKPVGASISQKTDMRVITATNRSLPEMVEEGLFREDLFYRLNVVPIYLPPLRERREDIPRLAYHFLRLFCRQMGKRVEGFTDEALEMLTQFDWPGNVRQLKNVVERLIIMADDDLLHYQDLIDHMQHMNRKAPDAVPGTIDELKALKHKLLDERFDPIVRAFLRRALSSSDGNISRAAEMVGMQRSNFSALMKKHGITRDERVNGNR